MAMDLFYQWWPPELVNGVVGVVSGAVTTWVVLFVFYSLKVRRVGRRAAAAALGASRRVLKGQAAEQLAPLTQGFPYLPADARFLGSPIDYIVFEGLADDNEAIEIVFVEVKTGKARLSARELRVKQAVVAGRVRWEECRLAENG